MIADKNKPFTTEGAEEHGGSGDLVIGKEKAPGDGPALFGAFNFLVLTESHSGEQVVHKHVRVLRRAG